MMANPTVESIARPSGEELQRRRTRKVNIVKGTLFALGMLCGGYIGYSVARDEFTWTTPWPPVIAVGMAVLYVVSVLLGAWLINDSIDEVEKLNQYRAVSVAGTAYMLAYPVWFLLWRAQLAGEPVHWLLFLGFWVILIGSALYYRFR